MRQKLLFSLGIFLIGILTISMVSAQGPRDGHHSGRDHDTNPSGFEGHLGDMEITGSVDISDAIIIELMVQPSEEALAAMEDHMQDRPMAHHQMPEDMSNTMTVKIDQLVEFVDSDQNGYSENDTIISTYGLNSTNLGEQVMTETENGSLYTITSLDDTFVMYLYLNENDGLPHSWKWSVEMTYGFQNDTSSLAILQSIESNGGRSIARHQMGEPSHVLPEQEHNMHQIMDEHHNIPMYFKWDDSAVVDGNVVNVTATRTEEGIAISIPQGESIFYDPEIGVELETLENANSLLENALQAFEDTVGSPTLVAIAIASGIIGLMVILRRRTD